MMAYIHTAKSVQYIYRIVRAGDCPVAYFAGRLSSVARVK